MRDYYYLSGLDESPYQLTLADALHLGATYQLNLYAFMTDTIFMHSYLEFDDELVSDNHFFIKIPDPTLTALEKVIHYDNLSNPYMPLQHGFVDDKYNGTIPFGDPFKSTTKKPLHVKLYADDPERHASYEYAALPTLFMSELLCFTEDLDDLVKRGRIKRSGAPPEAATAIPADDTASTSSSELHRAQRTLAALAIGLSKKHPAYRHGKKPNVSALAELAIDHLRDADGRAPHGFSEKTSRDTISEALKSFPELTEGSGQSD